MMLPLAVFPSGTVNSFPFLTLPSCRKTLPLLSLEELIELCLLDESLSISTVRGVEMSTGFWIWWLFRFWDLTRLANKLAISGVERERVKVRSMTGAAVAHAIYGRVSGIVNVGNRAFFFGGFWISFLTNGKHCLSKWFNHVFWHSKYGRYQKKEKGVPVFQIFFLVDNSLFGHKFERAK